MSASAYEHNSGLSYSQFLADAAQGSGQAPLANYYPATGSYFPAAASLSGGQASTGTSSTAYAAQPSGGNIAIGAPATSPWVNVGIESSAASSGGYPPGFGGGFGGGMAGYAGYGAGYAGAANPPTPQQRLDSFARSIQTGRPALVNTNAFGGLTYGLAAVPNPIPQGGVSALTGYGLNEMITSGGLQVPTAIGAMIEPSFSGYQTQGQATAAALGGSPGGIFGHAASVVRRLFFPLGSNQPIAPGSAAAYGPQGQWFQALSA